MLNCYKCNFADFEANRCTMFLKPLPMVCPYAEEKEQKPMLDPDALEVGFYAKGRDGNFYKVDLPVDFPFTKTINVMTGEIHYPNNYGRLKSMSMEEMAAYIDEHTSDAMWCNSPPEECPPEGECVKCILNWLKEEI